MKTIDLGNDFHGTTARIQVREDGTASAAAVRRAARKLCPFQGCVCPSDPILLQAEPLYEAHRVTRYRLYLENR